LFTVQETLVHKTASNCLSKKTGIRDVLQTWV
jgi:hypothetical protein